MNMNRLKQWGSAALAVLLTGALTGCPGRDPLDLCRRGENVGQQLQTRFEPCATETLNITFDFDRQRCEERIEEQCTDDDLDEIELEFECLERISECTPGEAADFLERVVACDRSEHLSSQCRQAFGEDDQG
jgi:hypothetical protein